MKEEPLTPEDYKGLVWPLPETDKPEGAWVLDAAYAFADRLRSKDKGDATMREKEWADYLNWTDPPKPPDDLDCARGISGCVVAGALFWVALALLWAAFKAVRVYW